MIGEERFRELVLAATPILDVRAPIEFQAGALPFSHNAPILDDAERAQVGTSYKMAGPQAATELGHRLVSGALRTERVRGWVEFLRVRPGAVMTCFRGGQRSQVAQEWLRAQGVSIERIAGGYKAFRQFYLQQLAVHCGRDFTVVAGATGAGKTLLLRELLEKNLPVIDLEGLACHRGSAFGHRPEPQPSQASFESRLSAEMIDLNEKFTHAPWLIEDESRMIGAITIPGPLFGSLQRSPVFLIEEPLAVRVENTFDDYVRQTALGRGEIEAGLMLLVSYQKAVQRIASRLGGARTQEVLDALAQSHRQFQATTEIDCNRIWIKKLLVFYYDPVYERALAKKTTRFTARGTRTAIAQAILQQYAAL